MKKVNMRVLGIESSCDETAAAVVENGRVIESSVIASQVDLHAQFGGVYPELRERCAKGLVALGAFDGFAIGGVSVGEPENLILPGVRMTVDLLPRERPRYLMGVGQFGQMAESVACGVDMFDCVMPTRLARHGTVFTRNGRYSVRAAAHRLDDRPLEDGCSCPACQRFSRGYVRHLLNVGEILGIRLTALHNMQAYFDFIARMRQSLREDSFEAFRAETARVYGPKPAEPAAAAGV